MTFTAKLYRLTIVLALVCFAQLLLPGGWFEHSCGEYPSPGFVGNDDDGWPFLSHLSLNISPKLSPSQKSEFLLAPELTNFQTVAKTIYAQCIWCLF